MRGNKDLLVTMERALSVKGADGRLSQLVIQFAKRNGAKHCTQYHMRYRARTVLTQLKMIALLKVAG